MNHDHTGVSTQTALITGASSGLGAEFAQQLAARGYRLALVARREAILQDLATKLKQQYGTTSDVLVADLSELAGITRVEEYLSQHQPLDLLINNAGFGTHDEFSVVSPERHEDMINVHVLATMRLCRAVLPGMLEHGQGSIINVASVAAFLPLHGNVNYSASKAYVVTFSEALQREVQGRGVVVQALCPGFTYTGFHDTPEYSGFDRAEVPRSWWMTSEEVVAASLQALRQGRVVCIPGWKYRWFVALGKNRYALELLSRVRRRRQSQLKQKGR